MAHRRSHQTGNGQLFVFWPIRKIPPTAHSENDPALGCCQFAFRVSLLPPAMVGDILAEPKLIRSINACTLLSRF